MPFSKSQQPLCNTVKKIKIILKWHREVFQFRNKENVPVLTFVFLRTTIRKVTVRQILPFFFPMFILFVIGNLFSVFSQVHIYIHQLFIIFFNYPFKTQASFWSSQLQALKQQDSNVEKKLCHKYCVLKISRCNTEVMSSNSPWAQESLNDLESSEMQTDFIVHINIKCQAS